MGLNVAVYKLANCRIHWHLTTAIDEAIGHDSLRVNARKWLGCFIGRDCFARHLWAQSLCQSSSCRYLGAKTKLGANDAYGPTHQSMIVPSGQGSSRGIYVIVGIVELE